jgi:CBS domain-containing protein
MLAAGDVTKAGNGEIMAEASTPDSSRPRHPATVGEIMEPALTTAQITDHIAAAAYLMKHASATALVVLDAETDRPIGIVTDTDVSHVVADGKNVNDARISDVMTRDPTVVGTTTSLREAAELMTRGHFRHLPVVDDSGLAGIVDISALCRALLGPDDL